MNKLILKVMKTEFKITKGNKYYPINVQVLKDNVYCGIGRFCKNNREVERFIREFKQG